MVQRLPMPAISFLERKAWVIRGAKPALLESNRRTRPGPRFHAHVKKAEIFEGNMLNVPSVGSRLILEADGAIWRFANRGGHRSRTSPYTVTVYGSPYPYRRALDQVLGHTATGSTVTVSDRKNTGLTTVIRSYGMLLVRFGKYLISVRVVVTCSRSGSNTTVKKFG